MEWKFECGGETAAEGGGAAEVAAACRDVGGVGTGDAQGDGELGGVPPSQVHLTADKGAVNRFRVAPQALVDALDVHAQMIAAHDREKSKMSLKTFL